MSVLWASVTFFLALRHVKGSPRLALPNVSSDISDRHMLIKSSSPPSVAIVNGVGYHTEVYTALLWSFQQAGASSTAFVEKDSNAGIQDAISDWYSTPFEQYSAFPKKACSFTVVVFATFPEHHLDLANKIVDKACPGQLFVLTVHNPSGLESTGAKAFLSRVYATVLALAPHTVLVASKAVQFMSLPHPPPVRLFVPVFPIKDVSVGCQTHDDCNAAKSEHRIFLLQGLFQSHRRDYHGLFEAVANSHELTSSPHFTLRLIGKGALEIPAALQGKVVKETNLAYEEYYKAISEALVVLPAFSSDAYYTTKASSSVATAIICGTPLLGDQQLLDTYSYLSASSVYLKHSGESDADAMARLLSIPADEVAARRDAIQNLRDGLYVLNGEVINEVLLAASDKN